MSLFFFDEIFFLLMVVFDVVAPIPEMVEHSFNGAGTAIKPGGGILQGAKAVLCYQFQDIVQPFFIRSIIHNSSNFCYSFAKVKMD
jgi:TRAP-type mannitol/chloroaromatic compound transport system permease small subunit